uniref:Uncharacterized protein n=1 Tax=Odontella aurita TaxID=265563 RepID=A0A6U6FQC5_9STRA|mmetsp:Transcript_37404/g.112084  ORF Transcript_37404/g.112084 Transcript_37404/m.112084 type:complete len:714 (+) Transcript_37404:422-2563(+)|eukprot:CAMPEP_0113550154 /NCGR_PEP_ID=MMETSP0015_2-20120614/13829_1 /TAXON_ID=2838 /ORGANISM="Odontella" /LENGTH=713 /DNA_ID=CAMNT_0000450939 /DNA_START=157 /DNA_END=2298 /DNA_ORIENTATION=- /assembly_acc=CAM_ASM_000160
MAPDSQSIVDMKLRALELKKAGDVEGAKALLAQARDLEFQGLSAEDLDDSASLKKLAVSLKRKGDLDGARAALAKAQRLDSPEVAAVAVPSEPSESKPDLPTDRAQTTDINGKLDNEETFETEEEAEIATEEGPVVFSEEEMLDFDMMFEFKKSGMDVPSVEDYQAKALACKKVAVKFKQHGDIEKAKDSLKRAKLFEAVMTRLNECDEAEDEINEEDEAWLMKELNQDDSAFFDESILFGDDEVFSLDDLDDMDAEMLKVMIDAGIKIPTPDEVLDLSQEKKVLALALKQDGNLVGAKSALVESKSLRSHADRLKELLEEISNGGDEEGIEDLEKLLLLSEVAAEVIPELKKAIAPAKSADELKQEVLKLREERRIKEATALFKLYKQALAREAEAAELEEQKKILSILCEEMQIAKEQERLFLFYERFIDSRSGALQLVKWKDYTLKCGEATKTVETNGSKSVVLARSGEATNMLKINDDEDFVGSTSDPTDERLEVAILSLVDIHENKIYQKMQKEAKKASAGGSDKMEVKLCLRVDVVIQLPPNEKKSDENINLSFLPLESSRGAATVDFAPSQFVTLPRGKSQHAKIIQRRIGRKRIQISVLHVHIPSEKPSSWLKSWSSKPSEEEKEPVLLGRVVLELKDFLIKNAIAGDFKLIDSGKRELGGMLRLGLQVGAPFGEVKVASSTGDDTARTAVDIEPFSPMELNAKV